MIDIGRPEPRAYIEKCMFSVIENDIRYQIVWRQYINMEGKLTGLGDLEPRKSSYMQDRIRKMRGDYLKRIKGK